MICSYCDPHQIKGDRLTRWFADLPRPMYRLTCPGRAADAGSSKAADRSPPWTKQGSGCCVHGFAGYVGSSPIYRPFGRGRIIGKTPPVDAAPAAGRAVLFRHRRARRRGKTAPTCRMGRKTPCAQPWLHRGKTAEKPCAVLRENRKNGGKPAVVHIHLTN